MNKEQATKLVAENENMVIAATYNILFTNDIVCGLIIESMAQMEHSALYRLKTKQMCRRVCMERAKYERLINEIIGDKDTFFADANDLFREDIDQHLNVLYYSVKAEFDLKKVAHSDLLARIEMARMMAEYSCLQFDRRMAELHEKNPLFKKIDTGYMRLSRVYRALDEVVRSISLKEEINLNTEKCQLCIQILSSKLTDVRAIARAISA